MLKSALVVEAVGHGQVFGVVGDGDVAVTHGEGGLGHFADGVVTVGGGSVHVQVAADVGCVDQPGQGVTGCRLDFSEVLAQLGGNPIHTEGGIDFFLCGCGDHGFIL